MNAVLLGIVNVTDDSFSDGGAYLDPDAALAHARRLAEQGADIIDLGAAASNPRALPVAPETEIARLRPLVDGLKRDGTKISIDSFAVETQRWALAQNVDFLNDIHGFPRPEFYPELARSSAKLIVMHAVNAAGPARREDATPPNLYDHIVGFFDGRIAALTKAGIDRARLILDPGMGLFLGNSREASFRVLRRISDLKAAFGLPVLISVSRKSFLRPKGRPASQAGALTLAAELYAVGEGADYIRTHDPQALRDGLFVLGNLEEQNVKEIAGGHLL
ncbi:MAG TPA: dihydropteroate synthase [Rhizomicrobium sp.]|nr:dihydropteroate synthase [Rhizomicrobium sp.]